MFLSFVSGYKCLPFVSKSFTKIKTGIFHLFNVQSLSVFKENLSEISGNDHFAFCDAFMENIAYFDD